MVPQLPQPPLDVLVGEMLGDVIDQEGAHCPAVVPAQGGQEGGHGEREGGGEDSRRGDGSVALLAGGVPDLGLDSLPVHLQGGGQGWGQEGGGEWDAGVHERRCWWS